MSPILCVGVLMQGLGEIVLTPSMDPIRKSVRIHKDVYTIDDKTGLGGVRIDADNITVDFQGATLQSPMVTSGRQETYNGIGLLVNSHHGVTIRNARIHGFQFNLKAIHCANLKLENCELSQSRSQKVRDGDSSNPIWLDLRGLDAWRGYGAGAWIEDCTHAIVKGLRANQSQNGLVMVRSNINRVHGCDFSYNSGWGIALCRSSDNILCWNHADFVNRPWAGGWGGDSAGMTETTHSDRNIWAFNSFTHSGDGFFLTALYGGFDDQDKLHLEGSCDGNWVTHNDGSWSTANAFESTFSSKNVFYRNKANDSNYGFWLGYSNRNLIDGNEIRRSHEDGIAHEQGSKNVYVSNQIEDTGGSAIHIWSGEGAKFALAPSVDNFVARNRIRRAKFAFSLTGSVRNTFQDNIVKDALLPANFKQSKGGGVSELTVPRWDEILKMKPAGFRMYRDMDLPKGWQWLSATTYGMKDYRKSLVPWTMKDGRTLRLYVRPKVIKKVDLPNWMEVALHGTEPNEWLVTPKPSGMHVGQYRNFKFAVTGKDGTQEWIQGKFLDLNWHVKWFKWFRNDRDAYGDTAAWNALFAGQAVKEEDLTDLPEIVGGRVPSSGIPTDHFAMVATTKLHLEAGTYRFDSLSDDGIQVYVDGTLILNNWTHHGATEDAILIKIPTADHTIEVRYCQEDGGAALGLHWYRVKTQ